MKLAMLVVLMREGPNDAGDTMFIVVAGLIILIVYFILFD